jgi:hypothetical protein
VKTDDIIKPATDAPLGNSTSSESSSGEGGSAVLHAPKMAIRAPQPAARRSKLRNLTAEEAYELLAAARTADHVEIYLRDGRIVDGAILFNDIKGTGRIINVVKEVSVDFRVENVRDIRF